MTVRARSLMLLLALPGALSCGGGSAAPPADASATDASATDTGPDGAAPQDTAAPTDLGGADTPLSCGDVGRPTVTAAPAPNPSPTSDFNVTTNGCDRTALALQCALGVAREYQVVVEGASRRLRSNGLPNHDVGPFPGPGNPNAIAPQAYAFSVPVTPSGAGTPARIFGVTTSGAVLDPGTAEFWNDDRNWNYEALRYATAPGFFSGAAPSDRTRHPTSLGLDCNFAHVQPTGAYHYHGIPTSLMPTAPALTFVGWAGDGYPIYGRWDHQNPADPSSPLTEMRASYRLRAGSRPAGSPGGTYDGTFVQDWEYALGSGDLDECNGRTGMVTLEGRMVNTYHYVLTYTWPYIPRCFHAAPDPSFRAGMAMPMTDGGVPMPGRDGGVMPGRDGGMMVPGDGGMGPRACTAPEDCAGACAPTARGCTCATTPMGRRCAATCTTSADCPMPMGMTLTCRMGVCLQ